METQHISFKDMRPGEIFYVINDEASFMNQNDLYVYMYIGKKFGYYFRAALYVLTDTVFTDPEDSDYGELAPLSFFRYHTPDSEHELRSIYHGYAEALNSFHPTGESNINQQASYHFERQFSEKFGLRDHGHPLILVQEKSLLGRNPYETEYKNARNFLFIDPEAAFDHMERHFPHEVYDLDVFRRPFIESWRHINLRSYYADLHLPRLLPIPDTRL